jgi:hypothetical protein
VITGNFFSDLTRIDLSNKYFIFRINQDLRSWVQDHPEKQQDTNPVIIPDPKSLAIPSNPIIVPITTDSAVEPLQHISRKVARQTKFVF